MYANGRRRDHWIPLGDLTKEVYQRGGTHDYTQTNYPLVRKSIFIEDDVWIGAAGFMGPGVQIGQGAVV